MVGQGRLVSPFTFSWFLLFSRETGQRLFEPSGLLASLRRQESLCFVPFLPWEDGFPHVEAAMFPFRHDSFSPGPQRRRRSFFSYGRPSRSFAYAATAFFFSDPFAWPTDGGFFSRSSRPAFLRDGSCLFFLKPEGAFSSPARGALSSGPFWSGPESSSPLYGLVLPGLGFPFFAYAWPAMAFSLFSSFTALGNRRFSFA